MTGRSCLLAIALCTTLAHAEPAVHHVLKVRLDPVARTVRAVDRVTLRPGAPAAFRLADGFAVEQLVVDGRSATTPAGSGAVGLELDPARTLHEVVVTYRGTLAAPPIVAVQVYRRREVVDDRAHRFASSLEPVNCGQARWRARQRMAR